MMPWVVEYTDQFGDWWSELDAGEQDAIDVGVGLLEERGPELPFPFTSGIASPRHRHMRELRIQTKEGRTACFTPSTRGGSRFS